MYADKGCGLAAPQVGVSKRVVVLDYATEDDEERKPMFLVNPEIIWKSEEKIMFCEGCLSLPDQRADVERHEKIRVHLPIISAESRKFWPMVCSPLFYNMK